MPWFSKIKPLICWTEISNNDVKTFQIVSGNGLLRCGEIDIDIDNDIDSHDVIGLLA